MSLLLALPPDGFILPESTLHTEGFAVLAAFVAINTVMYGALAVAKMLPKVYVGDWFSYRQRRLESRSIHPQRGAGEPVGSRPSAPTPRGDRL